MCLLGWVEVSVLAERGGPGDLGALVQLAVPLYEEIHFVKKGFSYTV